MCPVPTRLVTELQRLAQRQLQYLLAPGRERTVLARDLLDRADDLLDLLAHRLQADPQRLQRPGRHAVALAKDAKQEVLGADPVVIEHPGFFFCQDHNTPCLVGKPLEHRPPPRATEHNLAARPEHQPDGTCPGTPVMTHPRYALTARAECPMPGDLRCVQRGTPGAISWAGLAGLRMSWFCRPGQGRRVNAGADRVPPGVGQADPGDEPVPGAQGVLDQARVDLHEPELGAAEQPQRPVPGHVAPGQAEVPVGAVAADERAAEVQARVAAAGRSPAPPTAPTARRRAPARWPAAAAARHERKDRSRSWPAAARRGCSGTPGRRVPARRSGPGRSKPSISTVSVPSTGPGRRAGRRGAGGATLSS